MRQILDLLNHPQVKTLHAALGAEAELHLVGGCVRDAALNKIPKDLDFASKLTPDEVEAKLNQAGIRFVVTGMRRGTITALVPDPVEITTFRNPENETQFTDSILKDLPARDFTINAIALDINSGALVDPHNGLQDLQNGVIRCVGNAAKRFTEDPHRIIRMVRFGFAQGRNVDPETFADAKRVAPAINFVAKERIRDEFIKILCTVTPETTIATFNAIHELGLWQFICPEFIDTIGVTQNKWHILTVDQHIAQVVANIPNDPTLRLAAFFHDIAKPHCITEDENGRHFLEHEDIGAVMVQEIGARMKLPTDQIAQIAKLVKNHMRPTKIGPKGARKLIHVMGNQLDQWFALKMADKTAGKFNAEEFKQEWDKFVAMVEHEKNRKDRPPFDELVIGGNEIMALGIPRGPKVGAMLRTLMDIVIDDPEKNTPEELTRIASEIMGVYQ